MAEFQEAYEKLSQEHEALKAQLAKRLFNENDEWTDRAHSICGRAKLFLRPFFSDPDVDLRDLHYVLVSAVDDLATSEILDRRFTPKEDDDA